MNGHSLHSAEIAIIGCGAMGAAITFELARRGHEVITLEQFSPLHDKGSSHGQSRMIRKAYFEGDFYIPMLERSYQLWGDMCEASGQMLYQETGGLFIGPENSDLIKETLASAALYGLDVEKLSANEVKERFPAFDPPAEFVALYEKVAGILNPEKTWEYMTKEARGLGVQIKFDSRIREIHVEESGIRLVSASEEIICKKLVLAAGPWTGTHLDLLGFSHALTPTRRTLHWFQPENDADFQPARFPPNVWQERNRDIFYGFPLIAEDEGIKYAFHTGPDVSVDPDHMNREVRADDIRKMADRLQIRIPALGSDHLKSKSCLYTMTPDQHFALGKLPGLPSVTIAAGFSGHGHKFTPVVGEIIADLVEGGPSDFDLRNFDPARLLQKH